MSVKEEYCPRQEEKETLARTASSWLLWKRRIYNQMKISYYIFFFSAISCAFFCCQATTSSIAEKEREGERERGREGGRERGREGGREGGTGRGRERSKDTLCHLLWFVAVSMGTGRVKMESGLTE